MGDNSKPIDIHTENFQSLNYNEQNTSLSAYASAESSPSSLEKQDNKETDLRLVDEPYLSYKSDNAEPINTYWGLPPASSLLIDEEDKQDALEHSRTQSLLSQSKSFHDSKDVTKVVVDDKEYQSLPNADTEPLIKTEEIVEEAAKVVATNTTSTTTTTTTTDTLKPTLTTALSSAAASASSPNPECSPYKFLMNETTDSKTVSSLKIETSTTIKKDDLVIDNLASLNRKDSEKHDPILSGAAASKKSESKTKVLSENKTEKKLNKSKTKSPSKSTSGLSATTTGKQTDSTKVDHLPASSREFCMNLNFNLASAAAATAGGPIVVVDNSKKSPVAKEHNKFTSNASTSSIHNDLKMILEESKDDKKVSGKENKNKANKSIDGSKKDKPKPQRTKKDNKNTSKNNISNASFNSSIAETTTNSMTVETGNLSPTSKTNDLNLIKMMMLMVENNNTKKGGKTTLNKHIDYDRSVEEASLIEMSKQNGRYKYSKDFLMQIRDQRASFIDQIHPEIFKAYCYCMNGKYWDPEKYFDIVSFPGDYERIQSNRNHYNRSAPYNKSATSKYNTKQNKHTPNSTFNNSNSKNLSFGTTPTAVPNYLQDDSPQPLQVPKNSPKFFENKETRTNSKEASVHSIFESLGLNTDHMDKNKLDADKILLGLIKKDKSNLNKSSNLMEMLGNNKNKSTESPNILDNLLPKSKSEQKQAHQPAQKHYPLILTAQELEMSQLNQEKLSKYKLPNEISMTKLEELQQSMESNDSFAYKQLVKNLSNHPLNSAAALNNKLEASLTKLKNKQNLEQKKQQSNYTKPSWQVSNDGTNVLKQLLNLKTEKQPKQNKPKKTKSNKSPHLSMSHGSASANSSTGSSPADGSNKFPAVNPHEKPFENYVAEENRKQIEQVVASALSQVLSRSPNSLRQLSPTPRSPIEDLIQKINIQNKEQDLKNIQHEHFNSLLSKMNSHQQVQEPRGSDILKWFSDANKTQMSSSKTAPSLSEIEFMQMHNQPMSRLY